MAKSKRSVKVQSKSVFFRRNDEHGVHSEKDEEILFNAVGYMEVEEGKYKIKYLESTGDGKGKIFSTLTFTDEKRSEAAIFRSGEIQSSWFFENGTRRQVTDHYFFGDLSFCMNTVSVNNTIDYVQGGKFETEYIMELNGVSFERVILSLTVT